MRFASTKLWMSSYSSVMDNFPDSTSAKMASSSFVICSISSFVRIPCFPSIATCALLPFISCLYIFLSNEIDALNWYTSLSVSLVKRPPHNCAIVVKLLSYLLRIFSAHRGIPGGCFIFIAHLSVSVCCGKKKYSRSNPADTSHIFWTAPQNADIRFFS